MAAVGVIAFRSVVERRQQIGILRAIGYQRSMVSLSFMIETAFMVVLGVLSGTILAGNTAAKGGADCHGAIRSQGRNLVQTRDGCSGWNEAGGDRLGVDPTASGKD